MYQQPNDALVALERRADEARDSAVDHTRTTLGLPHGCCGWGGQCVDGGSVVGVNELFIVAVNETNASSVQNSLNT